MEFRELGFGFGVWAFLAPLEIALAHPVDPSKAALVFLIRGLGFNGSFRA